MRVIAGEYRRRLLTAPKGMATRPTSDRLREALFNVLAPWLAGASFLDLYAGSGANGIEALSRGAARVVFVEQAAPAVAAIRANLAALHVAAAYYSVEQQSVAGWLRMAALRRSSGQPGFDIVFLDPPYELLGEYAATLGILGGEASGLLAPGASVIAEHRRSPRGETVAPGDRYGLLGRARLLEQGDAALSFFAVQ